MSRLAVINPGTQPERDMRHETQKPDQKPDLRKGKPGGTGTEAGLAGHTDQVMPLPSSGTNEVNPRPGSRAGRAEGKVKK